MNRRAVFDCMVFLQALARPNGPAGRCLAAVADGACELVMSDEVFTEVREVVGRPELRRTFIRATDEDVAVFFDRLARMTTRVDPVPAVVSLTRDPKDAKYLDLAIAAGAVFVVTRDNDLLDLVTGSDADARAFRAAHPDIAILDPATFLRTLRPDTPAVPPVPPPAGTDAPSHRPDEAP